MTQRDGMGVASKAWEGEKEEEDVCQIMADCIVVWQKTAQQCKNQKQKIKLNVKKMDQAEAWDTELTLIYMNC